MVLENNKKVTFEEMGNLRTAYEQNMSEYNIYSPRGIGITQP